MAVMLVMAAIPFLIIDGYNLLHAAGLSLATYKQGDLHRQRGRLLALLSGRLSTEERQRCTIVFDAVDAPPGLDSQFEHEGMAVLFAQPGHEADELIEELVAVHSAARQLTVVSSDHRLHRAARSRRASPLDSEAFLTRISRRGDPASTTERAAATGLRVADSAPPASADVSYWLREFGSVDVASIAAEEDVEAFTNASDPWQQRLAELQNELNNPESLDRWLDDRNRPRGRPRP